MNLFPDEPTTTSSGALIDATGHHRLLLWRRWCSGPTVLFVMQNPSTADASEDDPTIRRCLGFAESWGFGRLLVANLFTYRATEPKALRGQHPSALNDPRATRVLLTAARSAHMVIAAWGADTFNGVRAAQVARLLESRAGTCHLGLSAKGHPKHPLYLRGDTIPQPLVLGDRGDDVGRDVRLDEETFVGQKDLDSCISCAALTPFLSLTAELPIHPGRCWRAFWAEFSKGVPVPAP